MGEEGDSWVAVRMLSCIAELLGNQSLGSYWATISEAAFHIALCNSFLLSSPLVSRFCSSGI